MTEPQDPWADYPTRWERRFFWCAVAFIGLWSIAVLAGTAGYIYQTLAV
jgi:hypothetical protein